MSRPDESAVAREIEAQIGAFFERVLDKVDAHPRYGAAVRRAIEEGRALILNYHTHGPQHGWCVSICAAGTGVPLLGLDAPLDELAHIRGIAREESHCDPLMAIFADRLIRRFALAAPPRVYLNGAPRA
ncbi:MAG: hypothetical protein HZA52_00575 [Planctomycetes bacterium]|nr:hypothetical protein [Planctomycetota bacterium]